MAASLIAKPLVLLTGFLRPFVSLSSEGILPILFAARQPGYPELTPQSQSATGNMDEGSQDGNHRPQYAAERASEGGGRASEGVREAENLGDPLVGAGVCCAD